MQGLEGTAISGNRDDFSAHVWRMTAPELTPSQKAIVRNADWFMSHERTDGFIDLPGDEFYGVRGDATLNGHSVTARMMAWVLTGEASYRQSAEKTLDWLAARQDAAGGWGRHAAFTLDAAQCVFEGFNTYQTLTGNRRHEQVLIRAARRMITGTLAPDGTLRLPGLIEVGEYAFFSLLAWKTTGDDDFHAAAEKIVAHLTANFVAKEGFWRPYDPAHIRTGVAARLVRPPLRWAAQTLPMRGRWMAKFSEHLAGYAVNGSRPQYAMSLMDAEALLPTHDGSCAFPELREQTKAAIAWAESHCAGPFPGSLVESRPVASNEAVFPLQIINDSEMAALWPSCCLLLAYCGLKDPEYRDRAAKTADWILSMQDATGGFSNFQRPDGRRLPLQSGNANFYACLALWVFEEVFGTGPRLYTTMSASPSPYRELKP